MNIHPTADCTNTIFGFEGPEKRLEVNFRRLGAEDGFGLRSISKDLWQEMLNFAKCTIISHSKTDDFDAYVLSESSLFVYPLKIMIKTCGTTTLLKILPKLLEYSSSCNLAVDLVMFSRKNFLFPSKQVYPHDKWDCEIEILTEHFGENGRHHILGHPTEDHWYVYVADLSQPGAYDNKSEQVIELMMHNLDTDVMKQFYKKPETDDRAKFPGIADIIPGSETDEFNFTPCGYSMNGLLKDVYSTIHITPEPHCSYVSFETNLATPNYKDLLQYVLNLFKPGTITVAYYTKGQEEPQFSQNWDIIASELSGYVLSNKTSPEKEGNCLFALANLSATDLEEKKRKAKRLISTATSAATAAESQQDQPQFEVVQTHPELAQIIQGLSEIRPDFLVDPSEC